MPRRKETVVSEHALNAGWKLVPAKNIRIIFFHAWRRIRADAQ